MRNVIRTLSVMLMLFVAVSVYASGSAEESNGTTTITLMHYMGEQQKQDGLQQMIDGFTAENPDVEFEVTAVEISNYLTTLKTLIAAGDTPDIMFGKPKEHTDLIEAGHLADLTGAPFLGNLADGAVPSVTYDDKVYGVPIDLQTMVVYYNQDVFSEHGLSEPETWSEFVDLMDTLEDNDVAPFAHPYKDSWTVFVDYFADEYVVREQHPDFYVEIEAGNADFADYPHFREVLERMYTRVSYNAGDDWGTDNATAQNMMATGEAAMYINGSWAVGDFINNFPDTPVGIFSVPSYEDPEMNKLPIGVDDAWMAAAASENQEIVLEFFDYITSADAAEDWMRATNTISFSDDTGDYEYDAISQQIVDKLRSGETTNFHAPVLFSSALEDVYRNTIVEFAASGSDDFDEAIEMYDNQRDDVL